MLWISLVIFSVSLGAAELPRFLTKHSLETLRFISLDGRYAYVKKKPGVLGMVSSFKSLDFLTTDSQSDFLVTTSRDKNRMVIETIPNAHNDMSFIKNHIISVVDYGNTAVREVGQGRNGKLHLNDEWISYFDNLEKKIHVQNLVTQKKYQIHLSKKANPFFFPEVEMINASSIIYTDINEAGYSALISYNLASQKSNIVYRTPQTATRLELCEHEGYVAVGEFPYEGVKRGSKIFQISTAAGQGIGGLTTIYSTVEQDVGNMICLKDAVYFVKTMNQDNRTNYRETEAAKLDLKSQTVTARSNLKHVTQILEMDGRVLIPFRNEYFVLEGTSNLGVDVLKSVPNREELELDI